MATKISRLQADIVEKYAADVGLEPDASYVSGAPLRPLPPLDVGTDSVMIVGAYPSARFEVVSGIRDVPVGDNMGPFEPERYFEVKEYAHKLPPTSCETSSSHLSVWTERSAGSRIS